jgi:hypothetical protein
MKPRDTGSPLVPPAYECADYPLYTGSDRRSRSDGCSEPIALSQHRHIDFRPGMNQPGLDTLPDAELLHERGHETILPECSASSLMFCMNDWSALRPLRDKRHHQAVSNTNYCVIGTKIDAGLDAASPAQVKKPLCFFQGCVKPLFIVVKIILV